MAAINIPLLLWAGLFYNPLDGFFFCAAALTLDLKILSVYIFTTRIISYVIPLVIVWTAYIGIACVMRRSFRKVTSDRCNRIGKCVTEIRITETQMVLR